MAEMTDDEAKAAIIVARAIVQMVEELPHESARCAALSVAVRRSLKHTAADLGRDFGALLEFFVRRLEPEKSGTRTIAQICDQIVFELPDVGALAIVVVGGEREGAVTCFTAAGDEPTNRARLAGALRGLGNGVERRDEATGQIGFTVKRPVLS